MVKIITLKFSKSNINSIGFSFLLTLIIFAFNYDSIKSWFYISNAFIIFICLTGLILEPKQPFSLKKIVYIFFLIFFGFIPLNDTYHNNIYWDGSYISSQYYAITNIYIIIGLLFFIIGSKIKSKNKNKKYIIFSKKNNINKSNKNYKCLIILLISIILSFLIFRNYDYSFADLFLRARDIEFLSINSEFFDYFIRPIPVMIFLIYWSYYPQFKISWFSSIPGVIGLILFFIAIITNAPTALPRFLVATLYLPFLLIFFRNIFFRKYIFSCTIISSLFIIFPFLDNFRYYYSPNFQIGISFDFLNAGHFDAYQNFVRVVSIGLVTYGYQLLGVILFWFPRIYWPSKPEGSGFLLAHMENLSLDNISFPFIAEGYINFGILGVSIFCLFLGAIASRLDYYFWSENRLEYKRLFSIPYFLTIGLLFMILRGNLLSSFAYSVSVLLSYYLTYKTINFILK